MNKPHEPTLELVGDLKGVELGGAITSHEDGNSFFLQSCVNVAPRWSEEVYYDGNRETRGFVHLYGHAGDIPLKDNRCDYVVSSHVIEHVPNPLGAFIEWDRVVIPGGYVLMIVPHKDSLKSDIRHIDIFTLERLERAYHGRWSWDNHPRGVFHGGKYGHWWKFTPDLLKRAIDKWMDWELVYEEDPDTKIGNGFFLAYVLS